MKGLRADLRHAWRLYLKTPASSVLAVAILAAAMAVVSAFLSLWSDLALKPHPGFEASRELVTIGQNDGRQLRGISFNLLERINEEATTIDSIAGIFTTQQYYDRDGEREPLLTELVTSRYFPDIRPRLQFGRPFNAEDHDQNGAPAAILSYAFWQEEYGGRPDVLGERLTLYGPNMVIRTPDGEARAADKYQAYQIVGVLARELPGTFQPEVAVWMPYEQAGEVFMGDAGDAYLRFPQLSALARLTPGAGVEAARTEIEGRYGDAGPELGIVPELRLDAMKGVVGNLNTHRDALRQVRLFLAGSILLALVAASNVSLFLLSRAPGRRRELSVRLAVGAPLKRLGRQLVTESSLLVVAGTVLGLLASLWLAVVMRNLSFLQQAQWRNVTPFDWRVLSLVTVFMLLLTMLVSLAPIMGLKKIGIAAGSRSVTARAGIAQQLAGTAQVIVAAVIGGAALAFGWYLVALTGIDRGFSAQDVYAVRLEPPEGGLAFGANEDALAAERERRRDVIEALPGVEAVAFGTSVPGLPRLMMMMQLAPPDDPEDRFTVSMQTADSAYFDVLHASLRDGRNFEAADRGDVIVNETLARRLWGRTDVIGEALPVGVPPGFDPPRWEVVGVIEDIAYGHPSDDPEPIAYTPINGAAAFESILIRSSATIAALQRDLQSKIDDGELEFRINSIQSVEETSSRVLAPDRARTALTVASALLVVLLAGFGFYGTQRFLVAAGRREYAILAALGAGPRALGRLVLGRGLLQGIPGLVIGSLLAFIVVAWMRDDFVSNAVSPAAVTAVVVVGIAVLLFGATIGPAIQARNTEPAPLLREE